MGVHLHMGLCMHMLHLGQHLHGTVCLCGAGCALARGRGLAQGCARLHSTVGDAQEHKLAQKRACTKAERGFAHRSVLAQGPCAHHAWHERVCTGLCVLAQGCAPPRGPRTFPRQLHVPLARGLAQGLAHTGPAHAFPWHRAFAQGALHEAALAQAWQLGTGDVVLTRGARALAQANTGLAQSPLLKRVGVCDHGGVQAPSTRV